MSYVISSPSSDAADRAFLHIEHNLALIDDFVRGQSFETFVTDVKTVYAVTRALEVISEASRRIAASFKNRHADIDWRRMAAAGNFYRHDYEDVVERLIWATVQDTLPQLRAAISEEIARRSKGES